MRSDDGSQPGLVRRFYREHVRPYLALQIEIGVCLLLGVFLELADPLILKAIIDRALGDGDRSLLILLVGIMGGVLLFRVAFRLISVYLFSYSGLRILFDFRQRAFEHMQRLSPYFFRGERHGDILARLTSDIDVLQRAAAHTVVNGVHDVLVLGGILSLLAWLDPVLTLLLLIAYPFLGFALLRTNRRLRRESIAARTAVGDVYTFLDQQLSSVRVIQEFRRQRASARQHVRTSRPWIRTNLRLSVLGAGQVSLADVMATGAFILVFLVGGLRALQGVLSLGSLVAFYTLATRMYRPMTGLIDINIDLQVARAALARVYSLLDLQPEIQERPGARLPAASVGSIRVAGVTHEWSADARVLSHLDLRVAPGSFVALIGQSGSGKSTLAALLARFLDPTQGSVFIDGLDVRDWKLDHLRKTVCLVTQENQLFHASLAENLRLAAPHATDDELRAALELVRLGDYLRDLPEGLETTVGEQGLRLSGGERQRLALARALLKDARILILDEATSALDHRTEKAVIERLLERYMDGTVIAITHRVASIRRADCIYVLEGGELVAAGTHSELLQQSEVYRELASMSEPGEANDAEAELRPDTDPLPRGS